MATHLDGNALAELPEETQQELKTWARANWTPGAPSGWNDDETLPDVGDHWVISYRGYDGFLADVDRDEFGRVQYLFYADELEGWLRTYLVPETVPLPDHLAQHFVPVVTGVRT
ncbi:hypothetical protein [Streptomyces prasinus]|uniref:hypothetical protein n=1 Tax=Streptomyces prasinus TaxID=67345 RepID=UPI00339E1FB0